MTWSSNSRALRRFAAPPRDAASPSAWGWNDLEQVGPEAEARARYEESHDREVQDAYRRGLDEGEERGTRVARNELRVAMRATLEALDEIRATRDAWEARLKERLVVLAAAIAQRVVERTSAEDPTVFAELAHSAVAAFPVEEPLRIRLHPSDHAVISDPALLESTVGPRTVRWVPDEDVLPGGCVVEGPDRIVDGRLDETLCRIVRVLTDG